jgi:hypothetical protein
MKGQLFQKDMNRDLIFHHFNCRMGDQSEKNKRRKRKIIKLSNSENSINLMSYSFWIK